MSGSRPSRASVGNRGAINEEAAAKPADGAWSALENVEHVAITEKLMLRRLAMQPVALVQEMSREREAVLYSRIATRSRKVDAPESAHPRVDTPPSAMP